MVVRGFAETVSTIALLVVLVARGHAQPPRDATPEVNPGAQQQEKLAFFHQRIAGARVTLAGHPDEPCRLLDAPLIQFENSISHIHDGFLFLWTHRGRPAALVKSYYNAPNRTWGRTYLSLATEPLTLREGERTLWEPKAAAISWTRLDEVPAPAEKPQQRLAQMRDLARQFQIIDCWGIKDPTDWRLRLLPSPLYRYEVPDDGVIDGALFGYVLTSAPEALVLVEARVTDAGREWWYAVSRCTRFAIRVSRKDRQIAEYPRLDAWPAEGAYFHIPTSIPDYPFARTIEAPGKE